MPLRRTQMGRFLRRLRFPFGFSSNAIEEKKPILLAGKKCRRSPESAAAFSLFPLTDAVTSIRVLPPSAFFRLPDRRYLLRWFNQLGTVVADAVDTGDTIRGVSVGSGKELSRC